DARNRGIAILSIVSSCLPKIRSIGSVGTQGAIVGIAGVGGDDFEGLLGETRRALEGLRSGGRTSSQDASAEPVHGAGTAAEGRATARAAAGGRLEELTVDPRLMRGGSEELCAQIVVAVNAAMDDLRTQTAQAAPEVMDPAALAGVLEELQVESARQMR